MSLAFYCLFPCWSYKIVSIIKRGVLLRQIYTPMLCWIKRAKVLSPKRTIVMQPPFLKSFVKVNTQIFAKKHFVFFMNIPSGKCPFYCFPLCINIHDWIIDKILLEEDFPYFHAVFFVVSPDLVGADVRRFCLLCHGW